MFDEAKQKIKERRYKKKVKKQKIKRSKQVRKELEKLALKYSIVKECKEMYEVEGSEYSQDKIAIINKKINKIKRDIIRNDNELKIINK